MILRSGHFSEPNLAGFDWSYERILQIYSYFYLNEKQIFSFQMGAQIRIVAECLLMVRSSFSPGSNSETGFGSAEGEGAGRFIESTGIAG